MSNSERKITYSQAINEALREEMRRNEKVIIMGEDVGVYGNIFGATKNLLEEFGPERVRDTPISEEGFVGAAVGLALLGYKPVVEIMYIDFTLLCANQIVNHAAKIRFMSGGQVKLPIVIRTQQSYGPGRYVGPQHSQDLTTWYMHIPGLKVVAPATPYDVKGLLKTAIRYEECPVFFIEHALLYRMSGPVPEDEYYIPIGKADIKREGSDITIISYSYMTHVSLSAAEELAKDGLDVEVVDLRTLNPLDKETIFRSVEKTGKVIIVEGDVKTCGIGAEIIAILAEEKFDFLKLPPIRISIPDVPMPFSPPLVNQLVPSKEKVIETVKKMMER